VDQIKAADKRRFLRRIGQLNSAEMQELSSALADLLALQ
jgi:mRNA-degrading endonuclease toxin of MazEF toxin-antitoxin module